MASCRLLRLVAETLLCRVWLQVAGVGCYPLDVVFFFLVGGSDLQDVVFGGFGWTLEINNKGRLKNNILIK